MALVERLAILITGDASGAIGEMKKVAGEAEKNAAKADGTASKFSGTATKIGAGLMAAGAGLLSFAVQSASTTEQLGKETLKLQRYTGMSAEQASKLAYASKMSGVQVDSLGVGLGKLSKAMETGNPAFEKLNISVRDSSGKLRSMGSVLPEIADKFAAMENGPEKTAAALQLFGRAGMDLMPFLNKGAAGIKELSDEAEKMGLVLSQDNIDSVRKSITAHRQLDAALSGVRNQIGLQMIPILTKFTDIVAGIPGPLKDFIGPLVTFGGIGLTAAGGLTLIVGQFKNIISVIPQAISGVKTFVSGISSMPLPSGPAVLAIAAIAAAMMALKQAANDAARDYVRSMGDVAGSGTTENKIKNLTDRINEEKDALKSVGPEAHGVGILLDSLFGNDKRRESHKQAIKQLEDQKAALEDSKAPALDLAGAEQAAADATSNHTEAVQLLSDALKKQFDPFFAASDAAIKYGDAQKAVADATKGMYLAVVEQQKALREHGEKSPEYVKATEDLANAQNTLRDAQNSSGRAALDMVTSMDQLKAQLQDHPELLQQNIDKINALEQAHRIDHDTAEQLRGRLQSVADAVNAIPDAKHIVITPEIAHEAVINWMMNNTADNSGGFRTRNASGGFLPAGRVSLVGEHGPELFAPSSSGSIVNALSTEHALGGGGGGNTMTINITMPPGTDGAGVVEAIRRYERMNGTGWRN